jgi:hypothetical protein
MDDHEEDTAQEEITTDEDPTDYSTAMTAAQYLDEIEALCGFDKSKNNSRRSRT